MCEIDSVGINKIHINIEKIIRISVEKTNNEKEDYFYVIIYFSKDCYTRFYFPTFEIANRFSNAIQQKYTFKGSSYYTPFIDCIAIQNDLLKVYFKENEKNKEDETVYYKSK